MVSSGLDPTTTAARRDRRFGGSGGGSHIAHWRDAAITDHKKLAPAGFLLSFLLKNPSV